MLCWIYRVWRVCVVSLDYFCRWQVQVSVYCARRTPAHLRCTQCSILLHRINIYCIPCICLWQLSQIQTCLRVVVRPGLVFVKVYTPSVRSIINLTGGVVIVK